MVGTAIASWIRLCLPSCDSVFESPSTPFILFPLIVYCTIFVIEMRNGRKQTKRGRSGPIFKKQFRGNNVDASLRVV